MKTPNDGSGDATLGDLPTQNLLRDMAYCYFEAAAYSVYTWDRKGLPHYTLYKTAQLPVMQDATLMLMRNRPVVKVRSGLKGQTLPKNPV